MTFYWSQSCRGKGACLTQWSYEPCCAGPPNTEGSWWTFLTKHGPLEEGMAKHSGILAARTPWTVWKGKKIWHQKMSPSGWKVSDTLLGKSRGQLLIVLKWWDSITNSMYMNLSKLWEITEGQGSLESWSPWGCKELDTTWWLNNNNSDFLCCISFCCTSKWISYTHTHSYFFIFFSHIDN